MLEDPDEEPGTYRPPPVHANKGKAEVHQKLEFHKQHKAYIRRLSLEKNRRARLSHERIIEVTVKSHSRKD